MALVEAASYNIAIKYNVIADLDANLRNFYRRKSGTLLKEQEWRKEVNIKALVRN